MRELECLFVGSSVQDILMLVDAPPMSDQRISASLFTLTCGGVSNIAGAAYQSLGGAAGVISAIGDDEAGKFISDFQDRQGFAYKKLHVFAGRHSSTSLVQVEKDGKRCLTCYGGCIDELRFEALDRSVFHHTRCVHLGVMPPELMLAICRYCKENTSALISVDSGNLPQEVAEQLLPYCDIFIPDNKTVSRMLGMTEEEACRYYVGRGAKIACVTAAERGTYAYDGEKLYHVDAPTVNVVDTTGAGDNFHGAFLYALLQGRTLPETIRFATAFASLTCESLGGHSVAVPKEKVEALMQTMQEAAVIG